jgi:hypothetical protein
MPKRKAPDGQEEGLVEPQSNLGVNEKLQRVSWGAARGLARDLQPEVVALYHPWVDRSRSESQRL